MFCPRCAAQNADDARFCRACGTDISLVPQAVTGQLAARLNTDDGEDEDYSRRGRRGRGRKKARASVAHAVNRLVTGLGFLFVALSLKTWGTMIGASVWWFWMLIP